MISKINNFYRNMQIFAAKNYILFIFMPFEK